MMSKQRKSPAPEVVRERRERFQRFQMTLGYTIVAASVAIGFAMSIWPRAFGLPGPNPAVGFGLAALALFRLYALRRELKRQESDPDEDVPKKRRSKRRACAPTVEGRITS
jgi:hypothetical protein